MSVHHQVSFPFLFLKSKITIIEQWLSSATSISSCDSLQSKLHPYQSCISIPTQNVFFSDPVLMRKLLVQLGDEAMPQFSIRTSVGSHTMQYILAYGNSYMIVCHVAKHQPKRTKCTPFISTCLFYLVYFLNWKVWLFQLSNLQDEENWKLLQNAKSYRQKSYDWLVKRGWWTFCTRSSNRSGCN